MILILLCVCILFQRGDDAEFVDMAKQERLLAEERTLQVETEVMKTIVPPVEDDHANSLILEVRAGTGV